MCTAFQLQAKDSSVVIGRTMEYPVAVPWELLVVPAGQAGRSAAPDGEGKAWTVSHGHVGIGIGQGTLFGGKIEVPEQPSVTDGVNQAGLYAGLLNLPSYTRYQSTDGVSAEDLIAPADLASFVLSTCSNVSEVKAAVESVVVWPQPTLIGVMPMHLVVYDRQGDGAVVEYVDGERAFHANPVGVVTNGPPFDWHLANLRNYVNLTANDVPPIALEGFELSQVGAGSGMLGLPGDFTPPSRFIRAAALRSAAFAAEDSGSAAVAALHILGSFDIPKGVVREKSPAGLAADTTEFGDYTGWSTVSELGADVAYTIRTYDDPTPRRLRLAEAGLDRGSVSRKSLVGRRPLPVLEPV